MIEGVHSASHLGTQGLLHQLYELNLSQSDRVCPINTRRPKEQLDMFFQNFAELRIAVFPLSLQLQYSERLVLIPKCYKPSIPSVK